MVLFYGTLQNHIAQFLVFNYPSFTVLCRHATGTWNATNASWSNDRLSRQCTAAADATKTTNDAIIRCALLSANVFTNTSGLTHLLSSITVEHFVADDVLVVASERINSVVTAPFCNHLQDTISHLVFVLLVNIQLYTFSLFVNC